MNLMLLPDYTMGIFLCFSSTIIIHISIGSHYVELFIQQINALVSFWKNFLYHSNFHIIDLFCQKAVLQTF